MGIGLRTNRNELMANEQLVLARTDTDSLMSNLRGEVGEVITGWLLMRHFISAGKRLESGDLEKDIQDQNVRFSHLMADKLSDELVGRLSELAENKVGQLTFYFVARKLKLFSKEVDAFTAYIIKTKIRDKRNRDVSHKQLPGEKTNQKYLHIEYRILLRAVALALRLIKRIDRHVLGPSTPFLWKEARKRRYEFLSPPRAGYLLVPYLNLSPDERIQIVLQELAEKRTVLTEEPTTFNGQPGTLRACKRWGVIVLGDRLLALGRYPLIELGSLSAETPQDTGEAVAPS
jgi:hypothetical protein